MAGKNQRKAYIYGLSAVLLWSTISSAFKISLRYLDSIQILLWADLTAILFLGIVLLIRKKFGLLFGYSRRQYLYSLGVGILNPFLYYLILLKAYDLLPAQEAGPINYTWGITLALLSIPLLKQKISLKDILAILVSYSGVVVISTHGRIFDLHFSSGPGVALALISTIIWSLYWIINTLDSRDPAAGLFLNFLFGLPFILLTCLFFSKLFPADWHGLAGAVYIGLVEMGLGFIFWLTALKLTDNTARISILIFITPFLALVFIHFFVGEKILLSTFTGLVLIVAGLILQRLTLIRKDG